MLARDVDVVLRGPDQVHDDVLGGIKIRLYLDPIINRKA